MPIYYDDNGLDLREGDFCMCPVDKRREVGFVSSRESRCSQLTEKSKYPKVIRKAETDEIEQWKKLKQRQRETINICKQKAQEHNLLMKITDVHFDDEKNKIIFHFTADKRVDFRELVRDLATALHSRIELWQIGVRDEAKQIDGMGVCGHRLCCASFIKEFQPITIRLAKDQDIFLSPTKLSGVCGRLMCCLAYEEEQYKQLAEGAPILGSYVRTEDNTEGTVIERNLITQTFVLQDANENKHTVKRQDIIEVKPPDKSPGDNSQGQSS